MPGRRLRRQDLNSGFRTHSSMEVYVFIFTGLDSADVISETIMPWLALWLFHYEAWHATGEWLGGGQEPTTKK